MKLFKRKSETAPVAEIDAAENAIANREVEGLTQRQIVLRRFFNHKGAVTSMIILSSLIVLVFTGSGFHLGPLKITNKEQTSLCLY